MKRTTRALITVELLLALAIIAALMLPVLTCMIEGFRQGSFTEDHLLAQARAQRLLDLVLAHRRALFARSSVMQVPPLTDETASWTHEPVEGAPDLRKVTVRVRWRVPSQGAPLPERELVLVRLVARPDAGLCPVLPLPEPPEAVD